MDEKKKNEVLAFFWFVVAALVFLSLLSYTPDDISFEISVPNSPTQNFVGIAGAYTAWALTLLFGKSSFFLVPLFLFWALAKWSGKKGQYLWLKIFSSVIFFVSACSIFSMFGGKSQVVRFQLGGILGYFVSVFLSNVFGNAGFFVALSLFLLSILLATELLVLRIAGGLFKKLKIRLGPLFEKRFERKEKALSVSPAQAEFAKMKDIFAQPSKPQIRIPAAAQPPSPARPAVQNVPAPVEKAVPGKSGPLPRRETQAPKWTQGSDYDDYRLPSLDLLQDAQALDSTQLKKDLEEKSRILEDTLRDFGIDAKVVEVEQGPTITRYELQPAAGVKVQKITSLENDIALAMRATSVRIVAPIPGKPRVGIEVPSSQAAVVSLKEILVSQEFQNETSKIAIAIGKDTAGQPMICNLADMPHLLIAGATNTGKSVCINSVLTSILFKSSPEDVRFLIVDPKMVELHFYNDLPHLVCPVVTDKSKVPAALEWLVSEMDRRYQLLSKLGAKNILAFNQKLEGRQPNGQRLDAEGNGEETAAPAPAQKMPYIVVVIDELADLMLVSAQEVEAAITRLAQLARAVGIHMILATQRPSVDVITGVIKANFPARIAFQVASKVDSRTILDENGADKLLGRGDLLLMDPRKSKLTRAQGAWVQDVELERVMGFIKSQKKPSYVEGVLQSQRKKQAFGEFERDEVYDEARRVVLETGQASVSMVQRRLGLGYTRAARLIDMMEEDGVVGPYRGSKPREILVERPKAEKEESV